MKRVHGPLSPPSGLLEILEKVRGLASAGRYRISRHAYLRMDERGSSPQDVRHALTHASECSPAREDCYSVLGADRDGDALTLIVSLDDDILVITLY